MRAIFIDAVGRKVEEVEIENKLEAFYAKIGCEMIEPIALGRKFVMIVDEEGKPLDPIDHDRVYGWINDGKDLVLVQYYVFDKVLKPAEYYEAGHPIYSDGPLFYEVKE